MCETVSDRLSEDYYLTIAVTMPTLNQVASIARELS